MNMRLMAGLTVLGVLVVAGGADARGRRASYCSTAVHYDDCCSSGGYAGNCGPAYTEQTVTAYRAEVRTRTVQREVKRMVTKWVDEAYTYTEVVPETVPQQQTVTSYVTQAKQVPYTYSVVVPEVTTQNRTVTYYTNQAKQVPYTYSVAVPEYTTQNRTVTYYTCVPEQVVSQRPVCRLVREQVIDPCTGCCRTVCKPVTELVSCTHTVMRQVPQTKEVAVQVCNYRTEQRQGTRTVYECVPQTREVAVQVCNYRTEQREATRTVYECVPQTKEVTVNVVRYNQVQKQGTRKRAVCEWVTETVPVTECYTENVPYQTTVRVPTYAATGCGGCN